MKWPDGTLWHGEEYVILSLYHDEMEVFAVLASVQSMGLTGIQGYPVTVEAYCVDGMPMFEIVGLPDAAVKESRERVRAAMSACRMQFPVARLTLNLAPADVRKEGPAYDLPIALAILSAMGRLPGEAMEGMRRWGSCPSPAA